MTSIRITGTMAEINHALTLMRAVMEILDVSKPYTNRGSKTYRVYVNVKDTLVYGMN